MAMEAPLVARRYFLADLFKPAFAAPTHDPGGEDVQPRPTRRRSQLTKRFALLSLKQVRSNETTTNNDTGISTVHIEVPAADQQPSEIPSTQVTVNTVQPPLPREIQNVVNTVGTTESSDPSRDWLTSAKTLPWRRLRRRDRARARQDFPRTQLVSVGAERSGLTDVTNQRVLTTAGANSNVNTIQSAEDRPSVISQPNALVVQPTTATQPMYLVTDHRVSSPDHVLELDTDAESVSASSSKLYRAEKNIYIGLLDKIPPPTDLDRQWRQTIRPQLMKNLMTAIIELPTYLSRAEKTIEVELCMSGPVDPVSAIVQLRPTIWIRCGSKLCQKSVQRVINDLSFIQRLSVHVTQNAPHPASHAPKALKLIDGSHLLPEGDSSGDIDAILPSYPIVYDGLANAGDQWEQSVASSAIRIKVESAGRQSQTVCGSQVHFMTSKGLAYKCTVGGMILVDYKPYALTTAHALWDTGLYTSEASETSSDSTRHLIYGPGHEPFFNLPSKVSRNHTLSAFYRTFSNATLLAASYHTAHTAPETTAINSSSSPSSVSNSSDFALLEVDFGAGRTIRNVYQTSSGHKTVNTVSHDLSSRVVSLLLPYLVVLEGQLLDGTSFIMDDGGIWETRKLRLEAPLAQGASGTWVVDGPSLLGVITAVYEDEPFAHMLPIASVFSGIQKTLARGTKIPNVQVMGDAWVTPSKHPITDNEKERLETPPQSTAPVEKPIMNQNDMERAAVQSLGREIHAEETNLQFMGSLVLMFLIIASISWEIAVFPLIMPQITDDFSSLNLVGWYGSIYFLCFAITFPDFTRLYISVVMNSPYKGFAYLLIASTLIFAAGGVCYSQMSLGIGILVGRALCGLGASGMLAGSLVSHAILKRRRAYILGAMLVLVHSIFRFLSPITAAALVQRQAGHRAFRYAFLPSITLSGAVVPAAVVLTYSRTLKLRTTVASPRYPNAIEGFTVVHFMVKLVLLGGGIVCLLLALFFGPTRSWSSATVLSLFIAGAGVCLITYQLFYGLFLRRLRKQNDVKQKDRPASSQGLSFIWGATFYSFNHFYPIWLRTVRNQAELTAGITYLPLTATYMLTCILIIGGLASAKRMYRTVSMANAFSMLSLGIMSLAAGLTSRLSSTSAPSTVLGLQFLFSYGASWGSSQNFPHTYWKETIRHDEERDNLSVFERMSSFVRAISAEMIGGCLGVAVAQTVFATQLTDTSPGTPQHSYEALILGSGATSYKDNLQGDARDKATEIFNKSLTRTFYAATATGALPFALIVLVLALVLLPPGNILVYLFYRHRKGTNHNPIISDAVMTAVQQVHEKEATRPEMARFQPPPSLSPHSVSTYSSNNPYIPMMQQAIHPPRGPQPLELPSSPPVFRHELPVL